jgi:hypothetical protein
MLACCILQSFGLGDTDPVWRVLDVVEDRLVSQFIVLIETDTVGIWWDNQIVNGLERSELVLECIIS